jgi:hypothetical protein
MSEVDLSGLVTSSGENPQSTPAEQAPAATETPSVEGESAESKPPEVDAAAETKKALRGVQKRIDELTRARYEAEERGKAEADHWRQQAMMAAQQLEAAKGAANPPKLEQYPSIEEFTAAVAKHEAEKVGASYRDQFQQSQWQAEQARQQAAQQAVAQQQYQRVVESKIQEAVKKYPDFVETVTSPELPGMQGTPAFQAVLESEHGAEVMYYLGKNPMRAHQIMALSPIGQIREIGRLEAAVSTGKMVSSAPPPAANVNTASATPGKKDPSKMTYAEFVDWRRGQIARRR